DLTVFLDIDNYMRREGRVAEDMIEFLEMIFHMAPDCRRDFHMSARVFKFHQSFASSNCGKRYQCAARGDRKSGYATKLLLNLNSRRALEGLYTTARRSRDPGICI